MNKQVSTVFVFGNAALIVVLSIFFFISPFTTLVRAIADPTLANGEIPRFVYQWHYQLSPKYESWANARVQSTRATELGLDDISGTEWPIFSTVYYLWTTEALQAAWEEDPSIYDSMPKDYAHDAIEAAAALVADPGHASWVKAHWGDDYMTEQNIFYRMLLISGLTSYQKLLGNEQYSALLAHQVESLSEELDNSPHGLLEDYPGETYPIDILPAIAAIQRADAVLETDHSAFVERAIRGFEGAKLDQYTGLPTYEADVQTGQGIGSSRGVGIAYMLIWVPELWPETAKKWYARYDDHYWEESWLLAGVREFSKHGPFNEWLVDVDAGPVIGGYGTAASAFGIGAARRNGRMDQAYPLSAEALVASWPLFNGTLLGPRILSNLSDAPFVGETAILFNLTRRPIDGISVGAEPGLPMIVYFALFVYAMLGAAGIGLAYTRVRKWYKAGNS